MTSTTQEKILIEQRVANEGPSVVLAYILWFFLGFFSAHRFYLGRVGSAILQIVLNCVAIGLIWLFIDLFLIPGMVRSKQASLRNRLTRELEASAPVPGVVLSPPASEVRYSA